MYRKPTNSAQFFFSSLFPFSKPKLIFTISMASLSLLALLLFFSLSLSSAVNQHHNPNPHHSANHAHKRKLPSPKSSVFTTPPEIHSACKSTRFPDKCETSLTQSDHVPPNATTLQIVQSAIWVSSQNLKTAQSMVKDILDSSAGSQNRTIASKSCLEVLHNSEYRTSMTNDSLRRGKFKDARAWMSATLVYQYDCWSGLKYANDTQMVNKTMSFLDSLIGLSSNALSMIMAYDNFGAETGSWGPTKTERDGFWEGTGSGTGGSGLGFSGRFPTKLKADLTVCKDGSNGCYKTVQEAVNAAPENNGRRFVIYIKGGVYEETVRVPLEKKNVVFLGDGMGKTVITGSANVGQPGMTTYNSATVGEFQNYS